MKRILVHASLVSTLLLTALISSARESLPSTVFSRLPEVTTVRLSPDGDRMLAKVNINGEGVVVVKDLTDGTTYPLIKTSNEEYNIAHFQWLNNEYVAITASFKSKFQGSKVGRAVLLSQHYTGKGAPEWVTRGDRNKEISPQFLNDIVDLLPDDPNHILMAINYDDWESKTVYKVEIGGKKKRKRVQRFAENAVQWITDQQHNLRAYVSFRDDTFMVYARIGDKKKWHRLWKYEALTKDSVQPLGFDKDPNILYVNAYNEQGFLAVFKVDIRDPELTKVPVYSVEGRDADGYLLYSPVTGEVIGISSASERTGYHFIDDHYASVASGVDKVLKGSFETLIDISRNEKRWMFYSSSSDKPGVYYLFDQQSNGLTAIASRYPELNGIALPEKRRLRYSARDGVEIEAYLTLPLSFKADEDAEATDDAPASEQAVPTIIFPHGGPISQSFNDFDYWTQFFANRGYAVLQMNFRGSSGYGYDFMAAGFENWGQEMQNDIVDGVNWLVEEGITDRERICIAGASYGGYAAMAGLAKTPDLFRCGISFAGVTDLPGLLNHTRRFSNADVAEKQLGKKRKLLKAQSPLYLVENIQSPLLLIHGEEDIVVPFKQAKRMVKALKKQNADYEYLVLEGGDHFLSNQMHRHQVFQAMDAFLARHLPVDN